MVNCKACEGSLENGKVVLSVNGYDLVKCPKCGTWTASPFPSIEQLIAFYQTYVPSVSYKSKALKKVRRSKNRIKRIMALAKSEGKKFLDVGCNQGYAVEAAIGLGLDAHGIDIDSEAIKASKQRLGDDRFTLAQVEDYAAAGNKADIIYSSEVIEHVHKPDTFVKALHSILNDNGTLYLTTPDAGHFSLHFKDITKWDAVKPPEHIIYFTRKGIRALLEKNGFRVEKFYVSLKPGIKLIARKI